jgi:TATA-box binding protein (TBP) (component of TFIID and TFIIIB)
MENPPKGAVKPKKKKQKKQCVGAAPMIVKKRKSFYNQATVIIHHHKNLNLKLFRNGSIHITGIIDIEQGQRAVHYLGDEIRRIYQIDNAITTSNMDNLGIPSWEVVMINSDFVCNFKIRREKLYEILDSQYNLIVNFESDNYPGVKTSYYWNVQDKDKTGICRCKSGKTCSGKGRGTAAPGDMCRKITISIFQSGKIIITGAREQTQIDDAYQFITGILRKYFNEVGRPILVLESTEVPEEIVVVEEDTSDVDEIDL